jgi:hypothetical protein
MKEAIIYALKQYYIIDKGFPERDILSNLNKLIKVVETDLNNNKYSLIYSPGTGNRDFNGGGKESQEKNEFKPKFSEPEKKANQKLIRKHGVDSFKNYIGGRYQKPVKESLNSDKEILQGEIIGAMKWFMEIDNVQVEKVINYSSGLSNYFYRIDFNFDYRQRKFATRIYVESPKDGKIGHSNNNKYIKNGEEYDNYLNKMEQVPAKGFLVDDFRSGKDNGFWIFAAEEFPINYNKFPLNLKDGERILVDNKDKFNIKEKLLSDKVRNFKNILDKWIDDNDYDEEESVSPTPTRSDLVPTFKEYFLNINKSIE